MTQLQQLIRKAIMAGEDYASIGRAAKINHVSISQYDKGVMPNGKNLARLAHHFGVPLEDLVEPAKSPDIKQIERGTDRRDAALKRVEAKAQAVQRIVEIMSPLSESQQYMLLARVMKLIEEDKLG